MVYENWVLMLTGSWKIIVVVVNTGVTRDTDKVETQQFRQPQQAYSGSKESNSVQVFLYFIFIDNVCFL